MSRPQTFIDWVKHYEEKSFCHLVIRPDCLFTIAPDNSFMQWRASDRLFIIYDTVGDSRGWKLFVWWYCLKHGIRYVVTYTHRNPKSFVRRFGAKVLKEFFNNEGILTYCLYAEVI